MEHETFVSFWNADVLNSLLTAWNKTVNVYHCDTVCLGGEGQHEQEQKLFSLVIHSIAIRSQFDI